MIAMWDKRAISFGQRHQLALDEKIGPCRIRNRVTLNDVIAIAQVTCRVSVYFRGVSPQQPGSCKLYNTEKLPQVSPHHHSSLCFI